MMNKSSIIGRMFANANATKDSDRTLTNNDSLQATSRSASPVLSSTRRNLFGIRLNHDQLAQDLKDMWQESIDRQTQNWGFDFQKLKPIEVEDKKKPQQETVQRFEWSKVNTKMNQFYNETEMKPTTFDKQELLNSDYETEPETEEEEEEDDALVIPTFYKYQRRQKLNETQNRLKLINQLSASKSQATSNSNAFSKMNNSGAANKKMTKLVHRPSARKAQVAAAKDAQKTTTPKRSALKCNGNKSLILTFSENRKDTLRSAATTTVTMATSKAAKNLSDMFEKSATELEHSSAFKQPLKQQSLLDMLKQRKRKTAATSDSKAAKASNQLHNLRPRATSFTAN